LPRGHRLERARGTPRRRAHSGEPADPVSDVGVRFGLSALQAGTITPAQFVDLNQKVGGADIDLNPTSDRRDRADAPQRLPERFGQRDQQSDERRDHRAPGPRSRSVPRRVPLVDDPRRLEAQEGNFPKRVFPAGVRDWTKPGIDQQNTVPWQTYQTSDGSVIYGGRPLGPAPKDSGSGWTSPSFDAWLSR
jgi:hypothetical protein